MTYIIKVVDEQKHFARKYAETKSLMQAQETVALLRSAGARAYWIEKEVRL